METLHLTFSYADYWQHKQQLEGIKNSDKLQKIFCEFERIRGQIFKLRYDCELLDLSSIEDPTGNVRAKFDLIFPCIENLARTADFISQKEYAAWERKCRKNYMRNRRNKTKNIPTINWNIDEED